jgi:hypothetical protein
VGVYTSLIRPSGLLVACLAAACAGAPPKGEAPSGASATATSAARPPSPLEELARGHAAAHGLELLEVGAELLPTAPAGRPAPAAPAGLAPGEALLIDEAGELSFVAPPVQWSCEPAPRASYRIARDKDGGLVILRLEPKVQVVTKHVEGACGVGCGPAPPPPQWPRFKLPKGERVSLASVPYDVTVEQITCDQPIPRP